MPIPRIYGHFESNSNIFICQDSNQRIDNCERGFIAWLKHLFGKNVYVDIGITTSRGHPITSRIYVPLTEVTKFCVQATDGRIGRAFANVLRTTAQQAQLRAQQEAQAKQQRKATLVSQYQADTVNLEAPIAPEFKDDTDIQKRHQQAQVEAGNDFRFGWNEKLQNDVEAVRLYRLAAAQGNAEAQCNLAYMHKRGQGGLIKSDTEAVKLYRLAAAQGAEIAQERIQRLKDAHRIT